MGQFPVYSENCSSVEKREFDDGRRRDGPRETGQRAKNLIATGTEAKDFVKFYFLLENRHSITLTRQWNDERRVRGPFVPGVHRILLETIRTRPRDSSRSSSNRY